MGTSIITNPFTSIPKSDKSHVRGWAMMWAQRLNCEIANKDTKLVGYDTIYIDHGVNFSGALNLFGGFNDEVYSRCLDLIMAKESGSKIVFLDEDSFDCDYEDQIKGRIGQKTSSEHLDNDFVLDIGDVFDSSKTLVMQSMDLPKIIIGDSHTASFSLPNQRIVRKNGQTLFSALRMGLDRYIKSHGRLGNEIDLCLGSIDIRHHVFRLGISGKELAKDYAEQVSKTQDELEIAINVCAPVPVEYEERKLPKSGQYKGNNFTGSRQQRLDFTMKFIDYLDCYHCDFDLVIPPMDWYEMDGEKYAKEIMEMTSSVHIAPRNYRSIRGW